MLIGEGIVYVCGVCAISGLLRVWYIVGVGSEMVTQSRVCEKEGGGELLSRVFDVIGNVEGERTSRVVLSYSSGVL